MKFSHRITLVTSLWLILTLVIVNVVEYRVLIKIASSSLERPIGYPIVLEFLQGNRNVILSVFIICTVWALLFSTFGGIFVARMILKPISSMIETMEAVEGSLTLKKMPLPRQNQDELYKLTAAFNRMVERIEESLIRQRKFVSDASHELKTTLTIIESYASMLRRWGMEDVQVQKEAIETIYQEAIRVKKMTLQLLDLAATENKDELSVETFDLVSFCERIARLVKKLDNRHIEVITVEEELIITADPMKMKQLFLILLDNAMKYSKELIEIRLEDGSEAVSIRLRDYGIGIPDADISHVFERFYRVDLARHRKTGGTGLGLSIAKSIVQQHHGIISIASEEGKGTEVIIRLPKGEVVS